MEPGERSNNANVNANADQPDVDSDKNYWFFLFFGVLCGLCAIVACFERIKAKKDPTSAQRFLSDNSLHIESNNNNNIVSNWIKRNFSSDAAPMRVISVILGSQVGFYALSLLTVLTTSVAGQEVFEWEQVLTASPLNYNFHSARGWVTMAGMVVAGILMAPVLAALAGGYTSMVDYVLTYFVIHFIVVSAVGGGFPIAGAWWTAMAAMVVLSMFVSEYLAYRLSTMSYHSSLDEPHLYTRKSVDLPFLTDQEIATAAKYSEVVADDQNFVKRLSALPGEEQLEPRPPPVVETLGKKRQNSLGRSTRHPGSASAARTFKKVKNKEGRSAAAAAVSAQQEEARSPAAMHMAAIEPVSKSRGASSGRRKLNSPPAPAQRLLTKQTPRVVATSPFAGQAKLSSSSSLSSSMSSTSSSLSSSSSSATN